MRFDAIVLAGGRGTRLGEIDKALVEVGGLTLLARVLAAVEGASRTVVVGPARDGFPSVVWVRDEPAGGPAAALAVGIERCTEELVAVLAVDHPFVTPATLERLHAALGSADAALVADAGGRIQPLAGLYVTEALRRSLRTDGRPGVPLARVLDGLVIERLADPDAAFDVDDNDALRRARERFSP